MTVHISVNVIVTGGKAYLPRLAKTAIGFLEIDPVSQVDVAAEKLSHAISLAKTAGNPTLPDEEVAQIRRHKRLTILRATMKASEKQLAKTGAWYNIAWTEQHIGITMSTLDRNGRWIGDRSKYQKLPLDTSYDQLAEIIERDARSRPEVW